MSAVMCSRCGMLVEKCECRVVFGMTVAEYDKRLVEQRRLAQERFERDIVEILMKANDAKADRLEMTGATYDEVTAAIIAAGPGPSIGLGTAEEFDLSVAALIADAEAICIHAAKDAET